MKFTADIKIALKPSVLDPQGEAVGASLRNLGYEGVGDTRVGKIITIEITAPDARRAKADLTEMCEKLLANTVIENFEIALRP